MRYYKLLYPSEGYRELVLIDEVDMENTFLVYQHSSGDLIIVFCFEVEDGEPKQKYARPSLHVIVSPK
jgi:hypothetical protein